MVYGTYEPGSPPPITYYLTLEKSVDQSVLTLPKGISTEVNYSVKVLFNTDKPIEVCYLPLVEG